MKSNIKPVTKASSEITVDWFLTINMQERNLSDRHNLIGIGLIIGVIIGTVVGAVMDNVGFWIAIGTSLGLVFGVGLSAQQKKKSDNKQGHD